MKAVKVITYKKCGLSPQQEISLAYKLGKILEIDYRKLNEKDLKTFWIKNNIEQSKKFIQDLYC